MKNILLILALAFTFNVNAATVTEIVESTSERVADSFIDLSMSHLEVETGLEWLDFTTLINGEKTDMTMGMSINEAADWFEPQGWRLASYDEVYNLFDMFFPTYDGGTTGRMQITEDNPTADINEARNSWLLSFGNYVTTDGGLQSRGWYLDEDGNAQVMGAIINTNPLSSYLYGPDFDLTSYTADSGFDNIGVFMVRDYTVVPIPAAVWLFGTGILALTAVAWRRA